MMNRAPEQHAEMLTVLWLAGQIIDAHIEHLMSFNDWLPLGPMAPDYDAPSCENTRAIRLLEDATVETQLLAKQAGDLEAPMRFAVELAGQWLTDNIQSDGETPGIALNIAGSLLHRLSGSVMLPPEAQSVVDRALDIFKYHELQIPDPAVEPIVDRVMVQWRRWFDQEGDAPCSPSPSVLLPPSGADGLAAGQLAA